MMRLLVLAAATPLIFSCARGLDELGPFKCARDGDCPDGYACKAGVCGPPTIGSSCTQGSDCQSSSASLTCDEGLKICTQSCDSSQLCPAGSICRYVSSGGALRCVPSCTADAECPAGLACLRGACAPTTWRAGVACTSNAQCFFDATLTCRGGTCQPTCTNHQDCGTGGRCLPAADGQKSCFTSCGDPSGCAAGTICTSIDATTKICAPVERAEGASCSSNAGCMEGLECKAGFCRLPCAPPLSGCPAGLICTEAQAGGYCVPDCTGGGTCAAGLQCSDLRLDAGTSGCVVAAATFGKSCGAFADCAAVSPRAVCALGRCVPRCDAFACGAGEVCSVPSGSTRTAGCVPDCTSSGSCPGGTQCTDLLYGKRGCGAPGSVALSCSRYNGITACENCSAEYSNVYCQYPDGGGAYCRENTTCGAPGSCSSCPSGTSFANCSGSTTAWWCKPNGEPGCDSTRVWKAGDCKCTDGRTIPVACDTSQSCETRCSIGCDPMTQDCRADGGTPKCALVFNGSTDDFRCVALDGTVGDGQPCTRDVNGGIDTCAKGLFCTIRGAANDGGFVNRVCQRYCQGDGDCAPGGVCTNASSSRPRVGVCAPGCSFFGGGCGAGQTCGFANKYGPPSFGSYQNVMMCRPTGLKTNGQACVDQFECAAGLTCGANVCRPVCDGAHPCGSGTCRNIFGLADGGGYCE